MTTPAAARTIAVGSRWCCWISWYPVASAEPTSGSASSGYPDEPGASARPGPGTSVTQVVPYQTSAAAPSIASADTARTSGVPS